MASTSSQPPWIFSTASSPDMTKSAPASSAAFWAGPSQTASTRRLLPVPCGSTTVPRTIWSAWRGLTPRRIATSTVSSKPAKAAFWTRPTASSRGYGRRSIEAAD